MRPIAEEFEMLVTRFPNGFQQIDGHCLPPINLRRDSEVHVGIVYDRAPCVAELDRAGTNTKSTSQSTRSTARQSRQPKGRPQKAQKAQKGTRQIFLCFL